MTRLELLTVLLSIKALLESDNKDKALERFSRLGPFGDGIFVRLNEILITCKYGKRKVKII